MLVFPGKDASRMFASSLKSGNFNDPEIYTGVKTKQYLLDVTHWSSSSPTAKNILDVVHSSNKEVYVVGMKGGFQCFSTDEITASGSRHAVVFVDLDANIGVRVRQPHEAHIDPNKVTNSVPLDNRLAFLHELGHAKQWIENPSFMTGGIQNSASFATNIRNAAIKMGTSGDANMPQRSSFQSGVMGNIKHTKATKAYVADHPVFGGIESATRLGWGLRIETDNIMRHEWPICDELRLVKRFNYRDLMLM